MQVWKKLSLVVQTETVRFDVIPNLLHGRKGDFCPLLGAHAGKTCRCYDAGDALRWHACKRASGVGLMNAEYGLTSSTKPLTSPFWSFSRVLACAAIHSIISTAQWTAPVRCAQLCGCEHSECADWHRNARVQPALMHPLGRCLLTRGKRLGEAGAPYRLGHLGGDGGLESLESLHALAMVHAAGCHRLGNNTSPLLGALGGHRQLKVACSGGGQGAGRLHSTPTTSAVISGGLACLLMNMDTCHPMHCKLLLSALTPGTMPVYVRQLYRTVSGAL